MIHIHSIRDLGLHVHKILAALKDTLGSVQVLHERVEASVQTQDTHLKRLRQDILALKASQQELAQRLKPAGAVLEINRPACFKQQNQYFSLIEKGWLTLW